MMKYIYLTLAFLCLICGSVGIVIPDCPHTFAFGSFVFFAKGSDRFHRWFLGTKLYHKHLESFVQHKTMKLRTKVYILMFSTCSMGLSIYLVKNLYVRIFIAAILAVQYFCFIFMIKTTPKQEILSVSQFQKKQREKIKA
ncbi:MAG: YbaN family protein [Acutalibacteraceae bacterium]